MKDGHYLKVVNPKNPSEFCWLHSSDYKPGGRFVLWDDRGASAPTAAPTPTTPGLRTDGPTIEEWVQAGYRPEHYPPQGWAEQPSAGLTAYRQSVEAQAPLPVGVPDAAPAIDNLSQAIDNTEPEPEPEPTSGNNVAPYDAPIEPKGRGGRGRGARS